MSRKKSDNIKKLILCIIVIPSFSCSVKSQVIENKNIEVNYNARLYENKTIISCIELLEDLDSFIYLIETSYAGYEESKKEWNGYKGFTKNNSFKISKSASYIDSRFCF